MVKLLRWEGYIMKYRRTIIVLIIISVIVSVGAVGYYFQKHDEEKIEMAKEKKKNKSENKKKTEKNTDSDYDKVMREADEFIKEREAVESSYKEIKIGQDIVCDKIVQFKIDSNQWVDTIVPSNTSGPYMYKEDEDKKSYYLLKGKIKNLSNNNINIKFGMYGMAKFNDSYNYTVNSEVEDVDKNSFDSTIDPLEERTWYLYASVPDEVKNNFKNVEVKIAFKDSFSYVSSDSDCNKFYKVLL